MHVPRRVEQAVGVADERDAFEQQDAPVGEKGAAVAVGDAAARFAAGGRNQITVEGRALHPYARGIARGIRRDK